MSALKVRVPVEEFTTPNPITVDEKVSLKEIKELMTNHSVRHIPITREGIVTGIISDRDVTIIQNLVNLEETELKAGQIMTPDPYTVDAQAMLDEVAFEMSRNKIGSAIVNDQEGEFLGIFTSTDALNALIEIVRGVSPETFEQRPE